MINGQGSFYPSRLGGGSRTSCGLRWRGGKGERYDKTMNPSESPFPCRWESFSLENVGLGSVRPNISTYGSYDFFALPALPFELCGDWSWLRASKLGACPSIFQPDG